MKKTISVLLSALLVFCFVTAAGATGDVQIAVSAATAAPGETVTLPVTIGNNRGFMYLKLDFTYDADALTLVGIENGTVSTDAFTTTEKAVSWDTGSDATENGILFTFTFRVKDDAAAGAHAVSLKVAGCFNSDEDTVDVSITDGAVTVEQKADFMRGDVDDDKKITASDARLALRRAVELETFAPGSAQFLAADVDGNGTVTASDARSILRAAVSLEDPADWGK